MRQRPGRWSWGGSWGSAVGSLKIKNRLVLCQTVLCFQAAFGENFYFFFKKLNQKIALINASIIMHTATPAETLALLV